MEDRLKEIELLELKKEEELKMSLHNTVEELEHLKKDKELFNMETEVLRKSVEDNMRENNLLKDEIRGLNLLKNNIESQSLQLTNQVANLEKDISFSKI